jgi:hypothetical protein
MTREEQNAKLAIGYAEATRYMDNAQETLKKAGKDGPLYIDSKYVRTACGTAYNGVLIALDAWFEFKGLPKLSKKQRKSIDYYIAGVASVDKKMMSFLQVAYNILHLSGYYDGTTGVKAIENGFDAAYYIIDKIKPEHPVETPETRGNKAKRAWSNLLVAVAVMFMKNRF